MKIGVLLILFLFASLLYIVNYKSEIDEEEVVVSNQKVKPYMFSKTNYHKALKYIPTPVFTD